MKPTRDLVLLAAGLVCVGAGAVLLFAPGVVPGLGPLEPLTDVDTATQVGLLLGLFVAVVAAFQMRRTARNSLDRSGLRPTPPEQPDGATVPRPSSPLANSYRRVSDRIGGSGRSGWQVVAYGRRARYAEEATAGRPDPQPAQPGFPGVPPASRADRSRRPPAQQDGGQPLWTDRRDPASNRNTGDEVSPADERAPPAGGGGRRVTERRPSPADGRQPAENRGGNQQGDRERRSASEGRQPTGREAGDQQSGVGPRDRADSDPRGRESRGRPAQEQRPTTGQFRRRSREQLLELLDDVAETAQDTYATATDCDPATAERAVAAGEWTDDRVAAAFLATDRDAPGFTITERAAAWLGPQRTLDRRLTRTLDAVERHADSYLTYERVGERKTAGGGEQA